MQNLGKKSIPSNEQVKEFWEWCGVSLEHDRDDEISGYRTTGCVCTRCGAVAGYDYDREPCLLAIDLDNLFEYAVPKIYEQQIHFSGEVTLEYCGTGRRQWYCQLIWWGREKWEACSMGDTPALALFWAIWKIMHNR